MVWKLLRTTIAACVGLMTIAPIGIAFAQQSPAPRTTPAAGRSSTTPPDPNCPIKGNISQSSNGQNGGGQNAGRRLYHLPGMRDYDRTVISPANGERWFCSEAEAIAAGWTKAPR